MAKVVGHDYEYGAEKKGLKIKKIFAVGPSKCECGCGRTFLFSIMWRAQYHEDDDAKWLSLSENPLENDCLYWHKHVRTQEEVVKKVIRYPIKEIESIGSIKENFDLDDYKTLRYNIHLYSVKVFDGNTESRVYLARVQELKGCQAIGYSAADARSKALSKKDVYIENLYKQKKEIPLPEKYNEKFFNWDGEETQDEHDISSMASKIVADNIDPGYYIPIIKD